MKKPPRARSAQCRCVPSWARRNLGAGLVSLLAVSAAAHAAASASQPEAFAAPTHVVCIDGACADGSARALPALVIGEVVRVDDPPAATRLLAAARRQGDWPTLETVEGEFGRLVRPVVIAMKSADAPPSLVTVLMTQFEFEGESLLPGTLVRYAPHGIDHEQPPADIPALARYWPVTGCVMTLCRAGDLACHSLYLPGAFDRVSGRRVDWRTGHYASDQPLIDPATRRALKPQAVVSPR